MIVKTIRENISPDTVIPKPFAQEKYIVKGWGRRRGEKALIYYIPNKKNPDCPHQKGVNVSEWRAAYKRLVVAGKLTTSWFKENLSDCYKAGSCNFTTVGGIFEILGLARYVKRGRYEYLGEVDEPRSLEE